MNKSETKKVFLLATLYVVTGKIGLMLAAPPGFATLVWPPSGIALGMLVLYGWRLWPGVLIGSFILNYNISNAIDVDLAIDWSRVSIALAIASGSTLQVIAGFFALKQIGGIPTALRNIRHAFAVVLVAWPMTCIISASFGTLTLVSAGLIQLPNMLDNWLTWWIGDTVGVMVFFPVTMLVPSITRRISRRGALLESTPVITLVTILLPLGLTFYAWKATSEYIYQKSHAQFTALVLESEKALRYRFNTFSLALLGGRGFITSINNLTKDNWSKYVSSLDVNNSYPGTNGIGYIEYVPTNKITEFTETVRKNDSNDFSIHPDSEQNNFFVIRYIEPVAINKEAVGLNIAFEQNRYSAAITAMETGEITITKYITLVQDKDKFPGFLMLLPVYKNETRLESTEQRKEAIVGWVYMPLISKNFLKDLTVSQGKMIEMKIYDGNTDNAPVIYSDREILGSAKPHFSISKTISLMQQDWTIVWNSTSNFEKSVRSSEPTIILYGGLILTGLFSLFLIMLNYRAEFANRLVNERTRELKENENRLNTILAIAPNGIITIDANGLLQSANKAVTAIFGYQEDELVGKPAYFLFAEKNILNEQVDSYNKKVISTHGRHRNGDIIPLEVRMNQIELQDGVVQTVCTIEDTTEPRKAELERTTLVAKLTESNTELERFAFVASHDLREPIRLICSFTDLLSQEYESKLDENAQKYIGIISMATRRMNMLVEELLHYARIGNDNKKPEWFESRSILEYVQDMLAVSIRESMAEITLGTMPYILADRTGFMLLLQNLIGNAIKYRRANKHPVIKIYANDNESEWIFSISDNGIGIKPEYRTQIFEPFKRLHGQSEYDGTGMGLAICRKIIDRMGGKIWVEESSEGGSVFYFTIPKPTTVL